jgi:hypothetical protein
MVEPLTDRIVQQIAHVRDNYYQLVIVAGLSGTGKTVALHEVHSRTGAQLINVNLDLSQRMLDLTERQRVLQLPRLLGELAGATDSTTILLDNIEILFDVSLKQDPLRLLQNLSRNKTLAVSWNGSIDDGQITYASPDHPEYRKYPIRDFMVISSNLLTTGSNTRQVGVIE